MSRTVRLPPGQIPRYAAQAGFGAPMQTGPGHNFREGILGSVLQAGPGRSYRDGVLGVVGSFSNDNLAAIALGAVAAVVLYKFKVTGPGFAGIT